MEKTGCQCTENAPDQKEKSLIIRGTAVRSEGSVLFLRTADGHTHEIHFSAAHAQQFFQLVGGEVILQVRRIDGQWRGNSIVADPGILRVETVLPVEQQGVGVFACPIRHPDEDARHPYAAGIRSLVAHILSL
ncbi:MAG: hypothetical protein PHO20_00295 [Candidatus Peribacteraceae bacterium]|nr:hypothetical protein [Candidatus Peribacteraceae bacterium]MDD5739196.1 hypothetical protein [Candidatus Peribacteraceae bacterium]